jgi:hypothetical protein
LRLALVVGCVLTVVDLFVFDCWWVLAGGVPAAAIVRVDMARSTSSMFFHGALGLS